MIDKKPRPAARKPARSRAKAPVRRILAAARKAPATREAGLCVAAIGASAGGFEATATLLGSIPADCDFAIVVVQHLDPKHTSQATMLLSRRTALAVETAKDRTRLRANHVYTIPSNRDAYIEGSLIRLVEHPESPRPHLPIDFLFSSLGEALKERAIGIVLSGTGSDGSVGLEAIVSNGGIVLVQQPETAQYDGMPRSAIATGKASTVLSVADMGGLLCKYARHPYVLQENEGSASVPLAPLEAIIAVVREAHSLDFSGYKREMVARRIERRMGLRQIVNMAEYAKMLASDAGEIDALRRDLLIGVTGFFRDPEAWLLLEREVVEPLLTAVRSAGVVRVWVAGAATGEEAYSLAMLLVEVRERLGNPCALQIFATDASFEAIAFARRGRYPAGIAAQVSPERLTRFFERVDGSQHFQVRPELRACVLFGVQKLIDDPPFSRLDLISCRNVLMYLTPEMQRKVLGLLSFALNPGGYLFLGSAESAESGTARLRPVSKRWRIYQRGVGTVEPTALSKPEFPYKTPALAVARTSGLKRDAPAALSKAEQILLEKYCAAAFLINQSGETLYSYGKTEPYLKPRGGASTHEILAILRSDLRAPVLRGLRRVWKQEVHSSMEDVRVRRDHSLATVRISIEPAFDSKAPFPTWLAILQDIPAPAPPTRKTKGAMSSIVRDLEEELRSTQHDLRTCVEQMESSTQELKYSNEQLVTVNEELQVANEELQSSKEELQSLNEELLTVNQQLQSKVVELETSGSDLENLLHSSEIVTMCFDRELRLRWFSPTAREACGFLSNDIGRGLATFADEPFKSIVADDVQRVMSSAQAMTTETNWKDRWYVLRILPYRAARGRIDGVIICLTDITESKRRADALLAERISQTLELEKGVADRTEQLRRLSTALTLTEERERRAIAVDLHDDLGQLLALLKMRIDLMRKQVADGPLANELDSASEMLFQATGRVRSLAFQLSPAILYDLGLIPALEWLADEMKRLYSLTVKIDADADARGPLDPIVRTALYRSVRELLINVGKHAGTNSARVECRRPDGRMKIVVEDSGKGFDPAVVVAGSGNKGFGLMSVHERLAVLGATMECESVPGDGSRVTLLMPMVVTSITSEPTP